MSYAGDVACDECWATLVENKSAQLMDVRTAAEWSFVGLPDLQKIGKRVLLVEWQQLPSMNVNPNFVREAKEQLEQSGADEASPVYTLCRSGARSISAAQALTKAGYQNVFNVLEGFEGRHDASGRRGLVSGWKVDNLPWRQG